MLAQCKRESAMRRLVASILVLVAIGAAGSTANAQKGLSTGPNLDGIDNARRIEENSLKALDAPRKAGLAALQAQDFGLAESHFAKLLSFDPTTSDANYLMGLAKLGLKKWPEAKLSLEAAVKSEPKRPEPKARLGVAHVMLGDINSAADQHDALSKMVQDCQRCPDAKAIADNLTMLDKLLVRVTTKPASAG